MKPYSLAVFATVLMSACAQLSLQNEEVAPDSAAEGPVRPEARPESIAGAVKPPGSARTVAQLDTTTTEQKAAAEAAAEAAQKSGQGKLLGRTVASLGDPTGDPGIWIKTPLVSKPSKGRVVYPVNGKAVQLDLIPIEGPATAGSRMSLAALRVIEAPLTELPEVDVYIE